MAKNANDNTAIKGFMDISFEDTAESLNSLSICYSALIDKTRRATGTRLLLSYTPDQNRSLIGDILQDLGGFLSQSSKVIFIAPFGIALDESLSTWQAPGNVVIEVPAIMLIDPAFQKKVIDLHARGTRMALRGSANSGLSADLLRLFEFVIYQDADDRRLGLLSKPDARLSQTVQFVVAGVNKVEDADTAFSRGATSLIGWPVGETLTAATTQINAAQATVIRLISMVNQHADVKDIEKILKLDPGLSFKLLRFINSPAFGLQTKISSFQHAVMLLGYSKLMRWLSVLLATAAKDVNSLPMMHASIRRGLFLEQICIPAKRDAMFITGAFSLLDKITKTPFEKLFTMISVTADVEQSLMTSTGEFSQHLALVSAIEQNDPHKIGSLMETLGLDPMKVNVAILKALASADEIEQELQ